MLTRLRPRYCPRFLVHVYVGGDHPQFFPALSGSSVPRLIDPLSVGLPQEHSLRPQKKTTRQILKRPLQSKLV